MTGKQPQILVSAGETSGDERAAEVISILRKLIPDLQVFGMGGDALRAVGAEILVDIKQTAVFGLLEAVISLGKFRRISKKLESAWIQRRPDLVLLVDFGGFNLRFARILKRHGAKIAYFISPQVWASRSGRIRWIKRYVDLMMVLFKFEKDLYDRHDVNAVHVGHPLVDSVRPAIERAEFCRSIGFDPEKKVIGLMPGSREVELKKLLPPLLGASERLKRGGYDQQLIIAAPNMKSRIEERLGSRLLKIVEEDRYSAMAASDLLILASGTAALESALLRTPAVVIYKSSWITNMAARLLIKIPFVSLPNIILKKELFPELLQRHCQPDRIASEALKILEVRGIYDRIRNRTANILSNLGAPGGAGRAAQHLAELIK